MRTLCRSLLGFRVVLLSLAAALLLLTPNLQGASHAGGPCAPPGTPPMCDGGCLSPGEACMPTGPFCECLQEPVPCGQAAGPPLCLGVCPPEAPLCVDNHGFCECVIPTLSEWGIIGMSLVMFGGVLFLRRRRFDRA